MSDKSGTSSQVISTPKGGGALQGIGETFSPDLFTGTGNFTVPLALPPGRNGFQPTLSLVYSSGNGNGPFGLGWALSVPGVTRKTSLGLPRYRDDSEDLDARDTFILSGAEDLIPISSAAPDSTRYRPRTEGLFARIENHHTADPNHWEVRSKDGLISFYGTEKRPADAGPSWEDPAVIANPDLQKRHEIFAWNLTETRDTFGNRILYEYDHDSAGDDSHRGDQLYLRRIRYVDYAERDQTKFLVSVVFAYQDRPDAFSSHRAGFEIRTRRRCKSIVVSTHADRDRRVRAYELTYLDERVARGEVEASQLPSNRTSLLSQIQVIGHDDEQPLPEQQTQKLPPLEFGYSRFEPEQRKYEPLTGPSLPPRSLGNADFDLADLFGNGLPDVFEMNGTARYWRNRGDTTLDVPREMADAPVGLALADSGVQLLDANGDGRVDLMVTTRRLSGFFSTRPDGLWDRRSFRRYQFAPSIDLQDPEVRLIDMDGDGVTDAIRSGTRFEIFFNDPREGWNRTEAVDRRNAEEFPDVHFSDPRVRWADMTGDGLQDVVLIHDGNIEYWPHLGRGRFGGRIRMANSPRFEDAVFFPSIGYDPKRVLVGDVDGDGLDDIVYIGSGHITVWINRSGNGWSDPITIHGTPIFSNVDNVRLVDMFGNGTAGILWSYDFNAQRDSTFKFLDLTGASKPYVLNKMDNHMGALTLVEYASSTRFYLADDKDPKTRWKTNLPFPVQVVSRVEVVDAFSRGKLTTEYRYHHGYWDGVEREFRGFGRVDQFDTETFEGYHADGPHPGKSFNPVDRDVFSPPTETRTWFHLGPIGEELDEWGPADFSYSQFLGEFFAEDPSMLTELQNELSLSSSELEMLANLPRRVKRDAIRTLRGRVIRSELYARDGTARQDRPFTVTESLHGVCGVLDKEDDENELVFDAARLPQDWTLDRKARRVFFPHAVATRTTQWERGDDPMTRFSFNDQYDDFGQPLRQTQIACPRNWRRLTDEPEDQYLATKTHTVFAAPRDEAVAYIRDRVAKATTFEVVRRAEEEGAALPSILRFKQEADDGTRLKVIGQVLNFYDGPAFVGLANGEVDRHGALVRSENLVLTEEVLHEAYKSGDALKDPPEIPPYLNPNGPPAWTSEYPQEFRDSVEALPGLAGFAFHAADEIHERGYFASSARNEFDFQRSRGSNARGLLLTVRDALGNDPPSGERGNRDTDIDYDEFDLLPVEVIDPAKMTIVAKYDRRLMQPQLIADPNGNESKFTFTPLGFLREIFVRGKTSTEGDQTRPSTRFDYGFLAFEKSPPEKRQPIFVRTIQHEHHDTETDVAPSEREATIESVEFSDGFGRLLQARKQAGDVLFGDADLDAPLLGNDVLPADQADDAGTRAPIVGRERRPEDPRNVVVSGWQTYDNKGRVIEKFEPFFSLDFAYLSPEGEQRLFDRNVLGQKVTITYDPLGRVVRTRNADGSERRVVFGVPGSIEAPDVTDPDAFEPTPWTIFTCDENDLAPLSTDPITTVPLTNRAPRHHHFTPSNVLADALGRTVLAIQRNRNAPEDADDRSLPLLPIREFQTRSTHDIKGNLLTVTDALDREAATYTYDSANNVLRTENIDAGLRRAILDAAGNEIERRDAKGAVILQAYDVLNRPTRLWARDDERATSATLRERLVYGDSLDSALTKAEARAANLLGTRHRHYDEAGLLEFHERDFKGNILRKHRRMIRDEAILKVFPDRDDPAADWDIRAFRVNWDPLDEQEPRLLDDSRYETSATYDALSRPKTLSYPADVLQQRQLLSPRYNRAGALERISLDGRVVVEHIAYDAKGQRTFIALGNGVITRYAHDPRTFRLKRIRSERYRKPAAPTITYQPFGQALQDLAYECDLVGNIDTIRDRTPGGGVPNTVLGTDALDRKFEYDAIYRLTFATGRECDRPAESPPELFNGLPRCADLTKTRRYSEHYRYDALGNTLELRHTIFSGQVNTSGFVRTFDHVPGMNQLAQVRVGRKAFDYAYDLSGNVTDENTERHFEWDHSDRMKVFRNQIRLGDGSLVEPTVYAHYLYDHSGIRSKKVVRKQGGQLDVTEYIDGLMECQRSGNSENSTLHIVDHQGRIATSRTGQSFPDDTTPPFKYELGDHLGHSNVVVSEDGELINREEYTPYGESSFGSFGAKRYRFGGKERDVESGLAYYGARYYAPWLARWVSCDPAGQLDSPNLYLFAVANPLVKIDRNGFQAEDVSNLERDLSRTEAAELTEFDPNWRQNMGFIKVHGNADIHGLLEGVHGEASIQGSASIADDVDTAYQRYLDMGVTEDDPMMGNFMRYNRERREHPRAIEQSQKRWKIAAIVGGLLLSGLVVAEVCFPAVAGEVTLGGSAAAGTAGAAAAETPGLNPGVPRPPAGSSGAPAEIPAGSGGASTPPPVYYHQINKGGLPDIVANQRLISTTAKEIAGGGDAVRASIGSFSGTLPVESPPVIEFTTDVIPRVNVGRGWGIWDLPAGEYLGIRVINIHYPPPW